MGGIAKLLKEQLAPMTSVVDALRHDFGKLEVQVTSFGETLESRMEDVEASIINTDLRVDKLEDMLRQAPMTSEAVEALIDSRFKELLSTHSSFTSSATALPTPKRPGGEQALRGDGRGQYGGLRRFIPGLRVVGEDFVVPFSPSSDQGLQQR